MHPVVSIFEGAAGLGETQPGFDAYGRNVQLAPHGGRPPFGPAPGPAGPVPQYAAPADAAPPTGFTIPTWGWAVLAAGAAYAVYHFSRNPEEDAADDDDDGDRYARNSASVKIMKPYTANSSSFDDDEDDEDDEDDDEGEEDDGDVDDDGDDEGDDEEAEAFTPNSASFGFKPRTQQILSELTAIKANYAR